MDNEIIIPIPIQELTAPVIVSLFETTKAQRGTFVTAIIDALDDGYINPLRLKFQLKCMEDLIKQINEDNLFKDAVLTEAQKHGKGSHTFMNCDFNVKSSGGKYNYSGNAEHVRLTELLKAQETYLKGLPSTGKEVVTEDGEIITDYPPTYKAGPDVVAITLK